MPATWTQHEIELMNAMAKGYSFANFMKGEPEVNTYEKTVIRNYMNIEYGSGASIEQLTLAYGYFGSIAKFLTDNGIEVPADLQMAVDASKRDLDIKLRDNRLKEIRALELKLEQLLSADEKRAKVSAEIARLKELVK